MQPGTVITSSSAGADDECSSMVLMDQLRSEYRLGEMSVATSEERAFEIGREERVPEIDPSVSMRITLLAFDKKTAQYEVKIYDGEKHLSTARVSMQRGSCGIVGGRDGKPAPYLFLVISPSSSEDSRPRAGHPSIKLVRKVEPQYPESAQKAGQSGVVTLHCTIATDGSVRDVSVLKSVSAELDESAMAAVRQWLYEPPKTADGGTTELEIEVAIRFTLDQ